MSNLYSDRVTYPELLKFYYACGFPELLGPGANSIALAVMFKANQVFFANSFRMSNQELSRLTGIKPTNIGRYRQIMLNEAVINEMPLFNYESRGQKLAGIYSINYELIPDKHNKNITKAQDNSQETAIFGNDHNKQTATEQNDHDPPKAPLIMPNMEKEKKISSSAAGYEKEWQEIRAEIGNSKLPAQIVANILMQIFQTRRDIFGTSFQDHEDVANAVGFGLDIDNGWRILEEAQGKRNPLGYIRSMGNKKGKEWSV